MAVYLQIFSTTILMFILFNTISLANANCADIRFDITCYNDQGQDVGHICTGACGRWFIIGPRCRPCYTSIISDRSVFANACKQRFPTAIYWQPSTIGAIFVANYHHHHHHHSSHSPFVICKDFS